MMICSMFDGDDNTALMRIQHDCYMSGESLVGHLFGACRERYLECAKLVEQRSEIVELLEANRSFDHRTLQDPHDIIAAYHRYAVDRGQPPLEFEGIEYREFAKERWVNWFHKELEALVQIDHFVRQVCIATMFPNPDSRGKEAEEKLARFLDQHYLRSDGSDFNASFYHKADLSSKMKQSGSPGG